MSANVCHESIRLWVDRFDPIFANQIRSKRSDSLREHTQWKWPLDVVFVKINGAQHYLWRAVDHEGEVLEGFVTKKHDKLAALRVLKEAIKRYGRPHIVVTGKLRFYGAAMRGVGNQGRQNTEQYANNRAENSHRPFRRRERGMTRFRRMSTLQTFVSTHASIYNHQRHLESQTRFKSLRDASLIEWRELGMA